MNGLGARRIGLLGGTFNPVHIGHLRAALEVAEFMALDELRLIPSARPPHRDTPQATAEQRLAMVELAVSGETRLTVDDRELLRDKPSYTVDTLESVRAELAADDPLFLLLGWDACCVGRSCCNTAICWCCSGRMPTARRRRRCAICWLRAVSATR